MKTFLENNYIEKRNVCNLFSCIKNLAYLEPQNVYSTIKQNKCNDNIVLSEIFDAYWWSLYSMLYSTEYDRFNSMPHDDYFYDPESFLNDTEVILKCEMMRLQSKKHRYPIPKKSKNKQVKNKLKALKDYSDFIETTLLFCLNKQVDENTYNPLFTPENLKMSIDMIRCSQERLIGYEPDSVNDLRKKQFIKIGNLLDDVFIHRGYITKITSEGGEMLTPEQLNEWESCKSRINEASKDNDIPFFIKKMLEHKDFMLKTI